MGTLALDIETASPFESPPSDGFDETRYFEFVAVGLGYRPAPDSSLETTVLFRRGGWDVAHTADLLRRTLTWCDDREFDRVLTYNGDGFDRVHLRNWAAAVDATDALEPPTRGFAPGADGDTGGSADDGGFVRAVERLFASHVDLAPLAADRYADRVPDWAEFPPFERACEWAGVDVSETRYADYDVAADFLAGHGVRAEVVRGKHVGKSLGAAYVEGVDAGLEDLLTYRELRRLLFDYTVSDVEPLFDLGERLGAME